MPHGEYKSAQRQVAHRRRYGGGFSNQHTARMHGPHAAPLTGAIKLVAGLK